MKLLAFDTSTPDGVIALAEDGQVVADVRFHVGVGHSKVLLPQIKEILTWKGWSLSELDAIAVGVGPGSFTGLRVGLATAQGLAFACACPLFGVNSLDAIAWSAPAGPATLAVCVDARKQEMYVGLYERELVTLKRGGERTLRQWQPRATAPTRLLTPEDVVAELKAGCDKSNTPVLVIGSGLLRYGQAFEEGLGEALYTAAIPSIAGLRAGALAVLAWEMWLDGQRPAALDVQPLYIRPSEAEWNIGPPEGGPPVKDRFVADGTVLAPGEQA